MATSQKQGEPNISGGHAVQTSGPISKRIRLEELIDLYKTMLISRDMDDEEIRLKKRNEIFFQISGAGHEAINVACGYMMKPGHDWFYPYYRDRALALQIGITPYDMLLQSLGAEEDPSSRGRQMPCHFASRRLNVVSQSSPTGTQYNQAVGCAEAGRYIVKAGLDLPAEEDEIVLVSSGEGATSEGEFWESLNAAANKKFPVLFLIEDNEYAISVPVEETTAGGSISKCFSSLPGLTVIRCDGTDLLKSLDAAEQAVNHLRAGKGPVLLHAKVTRPYSHSLSDDHIYYRSKDELELEQQKDCLVRMENFFLENGHLDEEQVEALKKESKKIVTQAVKRALPAAKPDPSTAMDYLYSDKTISEYDPGNPGKKTSDVLAMGQAINRTMQQEMERDERIVVFGEDVADVSRENARNECKGKGGVFKITYGLQKKFGYERVFNTPLAEAMILGRAIGMACRGLKPIAEIQFFDYIWPAFHQIRNELATMRFRSGGLFSAPAIIRAPIGGYLRGGGLYHSQTGETIFAMCPGIKIAYPSNAADAMGLLRAAIRMDDPVLFLEHKHLYYQGYNRASDPGTEHVVPFGQASVKRAGTDLTIVTWGATVQRSIEAAERAYRRDGLECEVIDIRTIVPLDREAILRSVRKTGRALVVSEEMKTGGFAGEIAAVIADEGFEWLDAPVRRFCSLDIWVAYSPPLEEAILPQVAGIQKAIEELAEY